MTSVGIRYLTGYAAATDLASGGPEWPPHPGRVFMALAAAYFECGKPPLERQALEWLESQPPPIIRASSAQPRSFYETYVPVNDKHDGILARPRQPRTFPKTRPDDDTVFLSWPSDPPAELQQPLDQLCAKVTRIGHSSSLVQLWLAGALTPAASDWLPQDNLNARRLRVASPGTLRYLEDSFAQRDLDEYFDLVSQIESAKGSAASKLKKHLKTRFPEGAPQPERPRLGVWQGYAPPSPAEAAPVLRSGPFDPNFIVLAPDEGRVLGLESTLQLTGALRNAAMSAAGAKPPEWLTGHEPGGSPSRLPHAAFFPLPFLYHRHADARVMGLAIALPRQLAATPDGRASLRQTLGPLFFNPQTGASQPLKIWSPNTSRGRIWEWQLRREDRETPPYSLRPSTWSGPVQRWATVTPIVLHHYPKRRDDHIEYIVLEAFQSAGFPTPDQLLISQVSAFPSAPHVRTMPPFTEGGDTLCRYHVHAKAYFHHAVHGPMLIGRGRFRGYGLLAPYREDLL